MLSCTDGARIRIINCAFNVDESVSRVGTVTVTCSANTFDDRDTCMLVTWPLATSTVTICSAYPPMTILTS